MQPPEAYVSSGGRAGVGVGPIFIPNQMRPWTPGLSEQLWGELWRVQNKVFLCSQAEVTAFAASAAPDAMSKSSMRIKLGTVCLSYQATVFSDKMSQAVCDSFQWVFLKIGKIQPFFL